MKKTPEEFYKEFAGYNSGDELATQHIDPDFLFRAVQGYADHCEESAWVSVENGLPEIDQNYKSNISVHVLVLGEDGCMHIDYYRFNDAAWGNYQYDGITHWRPLPKNPGKKEK